jgi:hypothetical protein
VLRAQCGDLHVSSDLHGIVHVIPHDPRGPHAPISKHGVGLYVDVDFAVGWAVVHVEPPTVLGNLLTIASLHEGVPQQQGEAMRVQTPSGQPMSSKV